jgi:hypothetical protein
MPFECLYVCANIISFFEIVEVYFSKTTGAHDLNALFIILFAQCDVVYLEHV